MLRAIQSQSTLLPSLTFLFLMSLFSNLTHNRDSCVFFFEEFNLIFDLSSYHKLKQEDMILPNYNFYLFRSRQKIIGEYVFNLCLQDIDIHVCPKPGQHKADSDVVKSNFSFPVF